MVRHLELLLPRLAEWHNCLLQVLFFKEGYFLWMERYGMRYLCEFDYLKAKPWRRVLLSAGVFSKMHRLAKSEALLFRSTAVKAFWPNGKTLSVVFEIEKI